MSAEDLVRLANDLEGFSKTALIKVTIDPTTVNLILKKFERAVPEDMKERWEALDKQQAIQKFIDEIFEDILDSDFFSMAKLKAFFAEALKD